MVGALIRYACESITVARSGNAISIHQTFPIKSASGTSPASTIDVGLVAVFYPISTQVALSAGTRDASLSDLADHAASATIVAVIHCVDFASVARVLITVREAGITTPYTACGVGASDNCVREARADISAATAIVGIALKVDALPIAIRLASTATSWRPASPVGAGLT